MSSSVAEEMGILKSASALTDISNFSGSHHGQRSLNNEPQLGCTGSNRVWPHTWNFGSIFR